MREKTPFLIITFETTTQAMAAEKFCIQQGLPGRIIPLPREINAGCGLSWKAPADMQTKLTEAFRQSGLSWAKCQIVEL